MNNLIAAKKCIVGDTYYLTGEFYDMETGECLINKPVVFIKRDKSIRSGNSVFTSSGQYVFKSLNEDWEINTYAATKLFIKRYENTINNAS